MGRFTDLFLGRQPVERRESGGSFQDQLLRLIESTAEGRSADTSSVAAVEAASGALARALSGATVEGGRGAVTPQWLGLVGRALIRDGESLSVIQIRNGRPVLIPAASWHWEGGLDGWTIRATCYGPSTSMTFNTTEDGVVWIPWALTAANPYTGVGPLQAAATTARLGYQAERSLADESQIGPTAIIPIPEDDEGDDDDDSLAALRADLTGAKGRFVLTETTAAGWGAGGMSAPRKDWMSSRLGPAYGEAQAKVARESYMRTLEAAGYPSALGWGDSDGTAQREALRRWWLGAVTPIAKVIEAELSAKLEEPTRLMFDSYPLDMVSRASVVDKLVRAGVGTDVALAAVGLDDKRGRA